MREIEKRMVQAIKQRKDFTCDNTKVFQMPNITQVRLHGHIIAEFDWVTYTVKLSNCGWTTRTTQSRLNAIFSQIPGFYGIHTKKGEWYLTDCEHNVTDWINNKEFSLTN